LKITITPKSRGYTGTGLAQILRSEGMECEFSDPDHLVLMLTPEIGECDLLRLKNVLCRLPAREPILQGPPALPEPAAVMSVRQAMLGPSAPVAVEQSRGMVLAAACVGCPPAVPILVCGEKITDDAIRCFRYYGVDTVLVCR
jgi:arginine/lysine/ornithine decarboxylase